MRLDASPVRHAGRQALALEQMTGGMAVMTFTLTFAGTLQTHLQRVLGQY